MENVRKYSNVRFESDPNKVRRLVASPFYENIEIIEETSSTSTGIVQIEKKQKTVKLNKPIYTGMKILYLSKFHMYDIWYNLLKPIFLDVLSLILMDTDSFVYFIKRINEKTYNKIVLSNLKLKNYLDFSKFPKDHPIYTNSPTECGKMKSEREGYMIKYAVALRSKMYYLDIPEKKKSDI